MDQISGLLRHLREAQGDTRAQAALAAEFIVLNRSEKERERFRTALDAAAVLHWFDAGLLEKVSELPRDQAARQFHSLKEHSFVERYRGEKEERFNLHEATRLGWRVKLAGEDLEKFRSVSARASACFAKSEGTTDRIEWIYHLLCGEPDLGASKLEELDREWAGSARPEDRYALATALQELEDTALVEGRARAKPASYRLDPRHPGGNCTIA
jgi:hypothetical protein